MCPTETDAIGINNNTEEEVIDSHCVVKFRPHDNWEGEFGFDWLREGDYKEVLIDGDRTDKYIEPTDNDGNVYKDNYGNPIRCFIVSNSNYAIDLVGKYGATISYSTRNGTTRQEHMTEIYVKNNQFNNYDGQKISIDPDYAKYLNKYFGVRPQMSQRHNINTSLFADTNYQRLNIISNPVHNSNSFNSQTIGKYYVPYISLFYSDNSVLLPKDWKGDGAKVKLLIEATNIKELKFVCDKGIKVFLIDKATNEESREELTRIIINSQTEENIIIKLSYDFFKHSLINGNGFIKIFALHSDNKTETLAGKLCVVSCFPKSVNVLFVPIKVLYDNNSVISVVSNNKIEEDKKRLQKFLSHAQIIPNIKIPYLNPKTEQALINAINAHKTTERDNAGNVIKYTIECTTDLLKELEKRINKIHPSYKDRYKVFILSIDGKGVNGRALAIPSKSAIIFKHDRDKNPSTICHELLHCFGLYHIFSNSSPFTFRQYKTSNMMDYLLGLKRVSSWKWQWDKIRSADSIVFSCRFPQRI